MVEGCVYAGLDNYVRENVAVNLSLSRVEED